MLISPHAKKFAALGSALVATSLLAPANTLLNDPADSTLTPPLPVDTATDALQNVVSKLAITIYGFLKVDAAYSTSRIDNPNFAKWVDVGGESGKSFGITARQSRLGMKIAGPEENGISTFGRIEVDFYGSAAAENKAALMLRHAYLKIDRAESDTSLILGQTSDVISPLYMPTVNYTVGWWIGNVGYRHNQVRLSQGIATGDTSKLLVQVAATRAIGGENSGRPGIQGRMAYSFDGLADKTTTIGLSAHSAREASTTDSNSICVDLTLPITQDISLQAEYFDGENLDNYLGGIGQGVNAAGKEIETSGYWAALTWKANPTWTLNAGYAMEEPEFDNLDALSGVRKDNSVLFGNVNYGLNNATTLGFEVARHETGYVVDADQAGTRFQLAATFKF